MKIPTLLVAAALSIAGTAFAKEWYKSQQGSATEGPGAGSGGILVNDAPLNAGETMVDVILTNVKNLVAVTGEITGGKGGQNDETKEIEEAIGGTTQGSVVEELKPKTEAFDLVARKQMLADLKNCDDADRYAPFIAYLESLQTHEARVAVYNERVNTLIKVHNKRLNFTERIKLAAELELMGGQQALAAQEMREVSNRMRIAGSEKRRQDAEKAAARRKVSNDVQSLISAP